MILRKCLKREICKVYNKVYLKVIKDVENGSRRNSASVFYNMIVWCAEADAPFIMPDYAVPSGPVGP